MSKRIAISETEFQSKVRKAKWKKFFTYKAMELGIIPASVLAVLKLPLWIGLLVLKIFGKDPVTDTSFCRDRGIAWSQVICDGVNYNKYFVWFIGFMSLLIITLFVYTNYSLANSNAFDEVTEKYYTEDKSKRRKK